MIPVRVNRDIGLVSGYQEYEIDTERNLELCLEASQDCDVFVKIVNVPKLRIRMFVNPGIKATVLFWNAMGRHLEVDESYEVMANGDLTVAYGECSDSSVDRNTFVALRQRGAQAVVSSASLVSDKKNYRINVVNYAPETNGDMKNYAVVLKGGRLMIDAVGRIVKGASRSESHQTSRALCFEDNQHSTILPELLIDDNDVQASHAMSIGRVDEDQLYYMMSRGLTVEQCTALLSTGYLMPITDTINNPGLKETLKKELERKIGELCSM